MDYVSFMIAAIPAALFVAKIDMLVTTSPQFFCPCAGYVVSRLRRTPWVFELRDLWPESIKAVGAMRNERLLRWLEAIELFLYRKSSAVVCVTEAFKANLVERGIDGAKISVVTNGADLSRFAPRPRDVELAQELGLTGKIVAGYVGTHGMAHGLSTVLEAAERVRGTAHGRDIRFLLLGDGAEKARLKAEARERGLDNVVFVDTVPRSEVPRYWSLIDISIIHLKKTDLFKTVVPSKLFECMAMGLPVLHGVSGESARIVDAFGVGRVFPSEDAGALAEGLLSMAGDDTMRLQMSARALAAAQEFDRSKLALRMLEILESLGLPARPETADKEMV